MVFGRTHDTCDGLGLHRTDQTPGLRKNLQNLQNTASNWRWHRQTSPEQLLEHAAEADLLVSNKVVLNADFLRRASGLKLICIAATGTNNVDLDVAAELGIAVANVTGYATPAVVQHVFSLILSLTTRQAEYRSAVESGAWSASPQFCLLDFPIRELADHACGLYIRVGNCQ